MRASWVAVAAFGLLVLGRWAHDKPALNVQTVVGGAFVIIVIAMLDTGQTATVAQGFAWLLLIVVALSNDSPLTAIANATAGKITGKPPSKDQRGGPPSNA